MPTLQGANIECETTEAGNCVHSTYPLKIEQPAELVTQNERPI